MLTENTVYLSKQIADALSEQGYALRPKPGEIIDVVATAPQHYSMYVTAPTAVVSEDGAVAEAFQGPSEYQELEAIITASKALNAANNSVSMTSTSICECFENLSRTRPMRFASMLSLGFKGSCVLEPLALNGRSMAVFIHM